MITSSVFAVVLNDNGRISATNVSRVVHVKSEEDIKNAIHDANFEQMPIVVMGKQHSQGGQSLAPNAIALDILQFNKIIKIDQNKKQATVQSGILWSDLQKLINPYHLAIKSMQSPNIFTVGGSLSVNAHGDDFRAGAVCDSVVAFHLILANGEKIYVTPELNPNLWSAVIGGYGLCGVVTDVTIQLTDNNLLIGHYEETNVDSFPSHFRANILYQENTVLFYAHLNTVPGSNFLRKMYIITYRDTHKLPTQVVPLHNPEKWNSILTPIFSISRQSILGKYCRWKIEEKIFKKLYNGQTFTRNNAMEKPVKFACDHHRKNNADWLQEYFIPTDRLPEFISKLKKIVLENNINLLNVTIRYVPVEQNVVMSYAKRNSFAVVLYFSQGLSVKDVTHAAIWTKHIIDAALLMDGSYYLPYQSFATKCQLERAYPNYKLFIQIKDKYDPNLIFQNKLYQKYLSNH